MIFLKSAVRFQLNLAKNLPPDQSFPARLLHQGHLQFENLL